MTRLLVLVALELEARTLARDLGLAAVSGASSAHFRGGRLEVGCVGLRAVHLEREVDACGSADVVISAGVCGALSPALAEGQLVVPECVLTADGDRISTTPLAGVTRSGTLLSPSALVASPPDKARHWIETGALAVDLESGPIASWARDRGRRMAVVRAVSDTAAESVPAELAATVDADGRLSTMRAVRAMARPSMLGRALTLRRGTAAALASVARALAAVARA